MASHNTSTESEPPNDDSTNTTATTTTVNKCIRVCVLTPSYDDSQSATKEWDSIPATPKHFFPDDFVDTTTVTETVLTPVDDANGGGSGSVAPPAATTRTDTTITHTSYTFAYIELKKATAYRDLRSIIKSNKYDVYFNLCDGAKDEDRAGEEVVRTLEEFNVPFTGAASKYFELSKPDMKMIAHYSNIPTARHAVLDVSDLLPVEPSTNSSSGINTNIRHPNYGVDTTLSPIPLGEGATATASSSKQTLRLEAKCAHLRFPVIVKHVSGYASIGMTKENKCETMAQLSERAAIFIAEFDFALVEEFIVGDEATVLACADETAKDGIRVYHPVMVNFPEGSDFKHFELKWAAYEGMEWRLVPEDDPSLKQILSIGRRSFKEMMGGIGYGRCDLRINRERNEVVFLEINPNCGIMYPPGQEGSADFILQMDGEKRQKQQQKQTEAEIDKLKGQRDFAISQIDNAIARCERTKPLWYRSFDTVRDFHLRAAKDIPKGTVVFRDEGRPVRLFTKPFVEATWPEEDKQSFNENAWPIGGAVPSATATTSSAAVGGSAITSPHTANPTSASASAAHYYAVWDINPANWRTFNHSDTANLTFGPNRSLNIVAARKIKKGEELTMNYGAFTSENMPHPKKDSKSSGRTTPAPTN